MRKLKRKYYVLSPDGISIHPSDTFDSEEQAIEKAKEWAKNYENQGYYNSPRFGNIPLDQIIDYCKIVSETPSYAERNELIALFLGHGITSMVDKYDEDDFENDGSKVPIYNIETKNCKGYRGDGMQYHTSWDWLMPVIAKINSLDGEVEIQPHNILATYIAAVEFIERYNEK